MVLPKILVLIPNLSKTIVAGAHLLRLGVPDHDLLQPVRQRLHPQLPPPQVRALLGHECVGKPKKSKSWFQMN